MSPGIPAPAPPPAAQSRPPARSSAGGCTFAEDPGIGAPAARILWHEALDPGTLSVTVTPVSGPDPDAVDLDRLAPWLTVVEGRDAREHAVLSDGWRRIRVDVEAGTLREGGTVILAHRLRGLCSVEPRLLPLRRLVTLCRGGCFAATLFPSDRRMPRWIEFLRVADARASGASYQDIAAVLFGEARTRRDWHAPGRSLHSQVRRLAAGASAMAAGGYRDLLRRRGAGQRSNGCDIRRPED